MRGGFLLTGQEIGRRGWTLSVGSFIEALSVCVSEEVPRLTHACLLHCLCWGIFFDLETDEVFLTDLTRFLSEDLSLGVAGEDFRFCFAFEADSKQ